MRPRCDRACAERRRRLRTDLHSSSHACRPFEGGAGTAWGSADNTNWRGHQRSRAAAPGRTRDARTPRRLRAFPMIPRVLTRFGWVKMVVLVAAVAGFVFLYEAQMFDSRSVARIAGTTSEGSPLPGTQLPFSATAYCKGTTTASGVDVRTGIAAADPSVLPVGTVLNLAAGDQRYTGVYTVMDTGPKVQGRHLDLYMWSCHEALKFGRRDVQVTVLRLGWDPRASSPSLIDRLFRGREAARRVPAADAPPASPCAPADGAASEELPSEGGESTSPATEASPLGN